MSNWARYKVLQENRGLGVKGTRYLVAICGGGWGNAGEEIRGKTGGQKTCRACVTWVQYRCEVQNAQEIEKMTNVYKVQTSKIVAEEKIFAEPQGSWRPLVRGFPWACSDGKCWEYRVPRAVGSSRYGR